MDRQLQYNEFRRVVTFALSIISLGIIPLFAFILSAERVSKTSPPPNPVVSKLFDQAVKGGSKSTTKTTIPQKPPKSFEAGLKKWLADDTGYVYQNKRAQKRSHDKRKQAAERITKCYTEKEKTLDLNNLQLRTLPKEIGLLSHLESFNLNSNWVTTFPVEMGKLVNLKELRVRGCRLEILPTIIREFVNLEALDAEMNKLVALPVELEGLTRLRELRIGINPLMFLPLAVTRLVNLEVLHASSCKLVTLPTEIEGLTRLRELHIGGNVFTSLPPAVTRLVNLEVLHASSCKLVTLPTEIEGLTRLRELYIGRNAFTSLPPAVVRLVNLEALDAERNHLVTLHGIERLTKLRKLNIAGNQLIAFPLQPGDLPSLQELSLSHNPLETLPLHLANRARLNSAFHLDYRGTKIPRSFAEGVERWFEGDVSCERSLYTRLSLYKDIWGSPRGPEDLTNFIGGEEKKIIGSFLTAIEYSPYFKDKQLMLAYIVGRAVELLLDERIRGNNFLSRSFFTILKEPAIAWREFLPYRDSLSSRAFSNFTFEDAYKILIHQNSPSPAPLEIHPDTRKIFSLLTNANARAHFPFVMMIELLTFQGFIDEEKGSLRPWLSVSEYPIDSYTTVNLSLHAPDADVYLSSNLQNDSRQLFERDLDEWLLTQSTDHKNKQIAKQRMMEVYDKKFIALDLQGLGLSSLPSAIKELKQLRVLSLSYNYFTILPSEIGELTQLRELRVDYNRLTVLSPKIGKLKQLRLLNLKENELSALPDDMQKLGNSLTNLDLSGNCFTEMPPQLLFLCNLKLLNMGRNQIKIVDESISLLVKLEDFSLNENLIEVLPATIGNLNALSKLGLKGNRLLRELPLSLGGVPGLTHVDTTDTAIPDECRDAILNMCQALRKQENGFVRLKLWMDVAGVAPDQYSGIQLESPEIIDLNEWLCRLEKTKDFCDNQQALTQIVCQMLLDLQDLEFKADFFLVVRENLTRCEDRAAMSLNLAYAVWKAHAVKDEKSAKKKCEVLVGLAKTNTLRKRLAQLIGEHDRKTVAEAKEKGTYKPAIDYSWKESVQGYLYYETHLQQVLGLVTAIQNMKYKSIGAVTWINKDELIAYVKDHYIEELMELPLFEQLEKEDKAYKESYDREVGELMNRVFLLDNQKNEEERAADGVDAKQEYRQLRIRLVGEFIKELLSRP